MEKQKFYYEKQLDQYLNFNQNRNKITNRINIAQQQFGNMAGFGLDLKLVLYLQSQCLIKSLGFLNPPHRQAAERQTV